MIASLERTDMSRLLPSSDPDGSSFSGSTLSGGSVSTSVLVPGPGVAAGGTNGQILAKASDDNYDSEWIDNDTGDITGVAITAGTGLSGSVTTTSGDHTQTLTHAAHTGDVTGAAALTIAADAVTYAKMQNVAADERILGRVSGADGVVEELTKTQTLTMLNVADGATANDTDANLKARANHTGTQAASTISDFDTEVANNSAVTANTAKVTNVSTDLSVTANGTSLTVNSSDGTNASLPLADTDNWGVMSDEMFDEHTANNAKTGISSGQASAITANTAKVTNVTTDLSVSRDGTKLDVVSSDGTNAVLPLADTDNWGVMSDEMFDEHTANNDKTGISSGQASAITANTAKVTNATHTGDVTGATALTIADNAVTIAKMAGLARGSVIIGDASGDPAALAIGNDTYVLTSDGADISWAAGGGGGGSGHAIKDEGGSALSTRTNLDFVGELVTATDNSGDDSTDITIDAKTLWLYAA